ncbi:MFS transporter, partial [Nonomuraea fuscirosea]
QMPAQTRTGLLESLAASISGVFWWAIAFAVVVPVLAAFIKEIPLRGAVPVDASEDKTVAPAAG